MISWFRIEARIWHSYILQLANYLLSLLIYISSQVEFRSYQITSFAWPCICIILPHCNQNHFLNQSAKNYSWIISCLVVFQSRTSLLGQTIMQFVIAGDDVRKTRQKAASKVFKIIFVCLSIEFVMWLRKLLAKIPHLFGRKLILGRHCTLIAKYIHLRL